MAKKKEAISAAAKKLILGELKRFVTIIAKYLPDSKDKKELLKKFEEVEALAKKAVG